MSVIVCLKCPKEDRNKDRSEVLKLACGHSYCWIHIAKYVKSHLDIPLKCPSSRCFRNMADKEIRLVLSSEDVDRYNQLCVKSAINTSQSQFHKCILKQCENIVTYEDRNTQFSCMACGVYNCIACNAAHRGFSCVEYLSLPKEMSKRVCEEELRRGVAALKTLEVQLRRSSVVEAAKADILISQVPFKCSICGCVIHPSNSVRLRYCFHQFCKSCLNDYIANEVNIPVKCPEIDCKSCISDQEIYKVLNPKNLEIYEQNVRNGIRATSKNSYHCQKVDCTFFCIIEGEMKCWTCRKCKSVNCLDCKVIHKNETCEEYQSQKISKTDDEKVQELIKKRELMKCPDCQTLLKKSGGCNWIKCTKCGVELCWILQIHRWGPKGRGDTSGGCKCGINGRCHALCKEGCIPDFGR